MKNKRLLIICIVLFIGFTGFFVFLNTRHYPVVLMYHKIDNPEHPKDTFAVSLDSFEQQMAFLKKGGYRVVSVDELCALIKQGKRLPRNLVAITFDDGYKDNLEAAKVLEKYDLPATIYIVLHLIDQPGYLTSEDLLWIKENTPVTFGSHTLNHAYLPELTREEVFAEVVGSKIKAKEQYGLDLTTFTYPVGGFRPYGIEAVKHAGYACAFTTNRGYSHKPHPYKIRRIKVADWDLGFRLWAKLSGFYNAFRSLR